MQNILARQIKHIYPTPNQRRQDPEFVIFAVIVLTLNLVFAYIIRLCTLNQTNQLLVNFVETILIPRDFADI